ncbi:V-type ATP synthase subunit I [Methanobrevibacter sp. OttesenSCG-928-K11]|nr:V-type ATP synthase subunit I [Methanobrevibacter sp. OttesenSCG-928-K11]MDL2270654.1 V-type ATP synthase subunit I [Methanobrevibacter sp. OttesenSCG-928-I08]
MFKTARMRKIKIITLDEYSSKTVNALHEEGIVQISDISDRIQQDPELAESLNPSKTHPLTGRVSSLLMKTTGLSELLGSSLSEDTSIKDMIMGFIKPEIPVPIKVEDMSTETLIEKAEKTLSQVEAKTHVIEEKFSALDAETSELQSNKSLANRLINFDMNLALLKDSKYTSTIVGRINVESASEIKNELSKLTDELTIFEVPNDDKETVTIVVLTLKEYKDDIYSKLRAYEFEKFDIGNVEGNPNQIISNADSRLKSIETERSQAKSELKAVAKEWDDEILILKELLENEKEKNEIFSTFAETRKTKMLEAWVPLKDLDKLKEIVEKTSEGHCIFEVEDIGKDDEEVPVLQNNKGYAKPYEVLVGMYAPVRYNGIDPTIFVAIMFPFFFGYCLTDAVYGAIVSLIGVVLIKGMGKISESMKSFGYILIACGIWAIILGLLTNGFLGDLPERLLGFRLPTVIPAIEAFVHPEVILVIAIAIGIIYTNLGFVIGAINNLRYDNIKDALGSQIVWFVFEAGIIALALGFLLPSIGMIGMAIGGILILISIGLLIYANGAYGIMDIFSYMGDILSYARLLALCLATGGIAMTVNILTQMVGDMIPFVGFILAIVVFIGGHIINFLFQVLGAFVNSLRLHYVEFFSQFYMSGKNKFQAFKSKRSFTKLND